jgi:dihydropyrimidinase
VFLAIGASISGSDAEQPVDEVDLTLCPLSFEDAVTAPDHAHDFETLDRGRCRLHCREAAHPSDHRLERAVINCDALWRGIADGHVDIIGADHIHRDVASKAGSVWTASPGCPGLETMLPVMLSEGHQKRGIGLTRIAALTAGNAAQAMGLSHCKGAISVGIDADFAVVDLNAEWTPDASCLRSSAGYSIYEGSRFRGRTAHTILRGAFIMRDRELDDAAVGKGRYLTRRI